MTRMNRNTAIAEPRPKSLLPPKLCRHIWTAITAASDWVEPGAIEMMMSKTFKTLISIVMKTTERTGASIGTVMRRKTCHSLAPSVREAGPDPDVGEDDRRRDQLRAEPRHPGEGRAERGRVDFRLQSRASDPVELERAVRLGLGRLHPSARRVEQVDPRAGDAQLAFLDLAGRAAAGAEVAPDDPC